MTTKTVTITNSIPIPKEAKGEWKNKTAMIQVKGDTIIIKRIEPSTWKALLPQLRKAGKEISQKITREAVAWARKKK